MSKNQWSEVRSSISIKNFHQFYIYYSTQTFLTKLIPQTLSPTIQEKNHPGVVTVHLFFSQNSSSFKNFRSMINLNERNNFPSLIFFVIFAFQIFFKQPLHSLENIQNSCRSMRSCIEHSASTWSLSFAIVIIKVSSKKHRSKFGPFRVHQINAPLHHLGTGRNSTDYKQR